MAVRDDLTVDWRASPRIITVGAPSVEITLQDLIDTCRDIEDYPENLSKDYLISAAGKESLGGGTTVGITATLNNAQVQFQARSTAIDSGSSTTGDTNGKILTDTAATFVTDGIGRGDTVFNSTTGAMASVVSVEGEQQLTTQVLSGGARADWQSLDTYVIYDNVQCNISGGNLVAVDTVGGEISPVFQSANTNVVRTASSSATNSDAEAIQYSSYNNGVTVDVVNGQPGTDYPIGNVEYPVDNFADAWTIATTKGLRTVYIRKTAVGVPASLDSGDWSEGYVFIGQNPITTSLDVDDLGANVNNCEFRLLTLMGTMDDNNLVRDCLVGDLQSFDGMFHQCAFSGTVTLGGSLQTTIMESYSAVAGGLTPKFDFGGTGSGLAIRSYRGGMEITNKTGADACSIDLDSGQVIFASTVTAGTVILRGQGKLTDNSTGTAVIDASNFVQADILQDGIERASFIGKEGTGVSIHPTNGTDSVVWPVGTRKTPCKTVQNAHDIAESQGFRNIYAMESINVNQAMNDGYTFFGDNPNTVTVNLDVSSSVNGGKFQDCYLTGKLTTGNIIWQSVVGAVTNLNGYIYSCSLVGPLTVSDHTAINKSFASPNAVSATVTIDFNGIAKSVFVSQWEQGIIKVTNMVAGSMIHMAGTGGKLIVDASCTGGMAATGGAIAREDNGTGIMIMNTSISNQVVTSEMGDKVTDNWQIMGLDAANAMTVTPTSRSVGGITQQITGDAVTTSTVTRI